MVRWGRVLDGLLGRAFLNQFPSLSGSLTGPGWVNEHLVADFSSPWPCLSQVVSFPVWFLPDRLDWRTAPLLSGCDKRPRRTFTRSPRAVPWEIALPWVTVMISQNAVAAPVRAARGRGSASAKVVGASTSHGVGTSVTARMPTASVRSVAGRRPGGRLDGVWRQRPKPRMPRRSVGADSAANLCQRRVPASLR